MVFVFDLASRLIDKFLEIFQSCIKGENIISNSFIFLQNLIEYKYKFYFIKSLH